MLSSSGYNSSRIGFRGTEDLGGGLAASFWLEAPVANDSGASAIANFGRRSTVSLSGPFGELRLGRDYTASFWNDGVFDPMTVNGVGTNLIAVVNSNLAASRALASGGLLNGGLSAGTDNYLRTSNAVSYFLPPELGGFYGQVQYALHENVKSQNAAAPSSRAGAMPAPASAGPRARPTWRWPTARAPCADTATTGEKIKTINLGASYDFGPLKLFGELSRVQDQRDLNPSYPHHRQVHRRADRRHGADRPGAGARFLRPGEVRQRRRAAGCGRLGQQAGARLRAQPVQAHRAVCHRGQDPHQRRAQQPGRHGRDAAGAEHPGDLSQPGYSSAAGWQPRGATGYDFGIRHAF